MQGTEPKHVSIGAIIALASAYAACYELTRHFSYAHWLLPAGLRLAALLLVPPRYWAALALGEFLPVAENAALNAGQFGTGWALLNGIPVIVVCMPFVALARRYASVRRPDGDINVSMVLAVTLGCAVINATLNDAALMAALAASPGAWPEIDGHAYFYAYLLGAYLGALTLTPTIMALAQGWHAWQRGQREILHQPMSGGLLIGASLTLVVLTVLAQGSEGSVLQTLRCAMALPVIAVTLRFGWQGGAVAGLLASVLLATTSGAMLDSPMIHAQVVLALAISGSLLVGVPITKRYRMRALRRAMSQAALS